MSDTIIYVDKRFVVMNSLVSCLTSIFDLSNPNMKPLHCGARIDSSLQDICFQKAWTHDYNGFVVKAVQKESSNIGSISVVCWNWETLCSPLANISGTESVSGQTYQSMCFHIAEPSFILFCSRNSSVAISCWQSFNSLYKHLTSTVSEHLELGQGPSLANWRMGSDFSFCIA